MGSQVYSLACLPLPPALHGAVLLSTFTPHQGLYLWPLALNQQRTPNAVDIVPAFVEFNPRKEDRLWRILKEMGIPDHLTCLLRNLYAGQEATVRTIHGTTDWFKIGKEYIRAGIFSPCLFNIHAEYIMGNTGL